MLYGEINFNLNWCMFSFNWFYIFYVRSLFHCTKLGMISYMFREVMSCPLKCFINARRNIQINHSN